MKSRIFCEFDFLSNESKEESYMTRIKNKDIVRIRDFYHSDKIDEPTKKKVILFVTSVAKSNSGDLGEEKNISQITDSSGVELLLDTTIRPGNERGVSSSLSAQNISKPTL